jgi:hypothetical protein
MSWRSTCTAQLTVFRVLIPEQAIATKVVCVLAAGLHSVQGRASCPIHILSWHRKLGSGAL